QVEDSRDPNLPAHLLVVLRATEDGVYLLDPPFPAYFLSWNSLENCWTGRALVFPADQSEADAIERAAAQQDMRPWAWLGLSGSCALLFIVLRGRVFSIARRGIRMISYRRIALACSSVLLLFLLLGLAGAFRDIALFNRNEAQAEFDAPTVELGELTPGDHTIRIPV